MDAGAREENRGVELVVDTGAIAMVLRVAVRKVGRRRLGVS
jgi:hypothetical protein